jgi:DNA polymerase V
MAGPIAIVDCNNFYASCERLFHPKMNGKPVVVLSNNDGFCNRASAVKGAVLLPLPKVRTGWIAVICRLSLDSADAEGVPPDGLSAKPPRLWYPPPIVRLPSMRRLQHAAHGLEHGQPPQHALRHVPQR